MSDHGFYGKILDIFLVLGTTREYFRTYSAQDIKKLIEAKMKAKTTREPKALQELYKLEAMIKELRQTIEIAKIEQERIQE